MTTDDIAPQDYTWEHAAQDLAMGTSLTLREAGDLVDGLTSGVIRGAVAITPYDALPLLITLVRGLRRESRSTIERAGYALRRIIVNEPPR